ncbi:hypothetical protein AB837_00523 [bacterium AB1]|nr:hypothetical protein AB837_00523 [bacterium AB1]
MLFFFIKMVLFFQLKTLNQGNIKSKISKNINQIQQIYESGDGVILSTHFINFKIDLLYHLDCVEQSHGVIQGLEQSETLFINLEQRKKEKFQKSFLQVLNLYSNSVRDHINSINNELLFIKKLFEEKRENDTLLSIRRLFGETEEENDDLSSIQQLLEKIKEYNPSIDYNNNLLLSLFSNIVNLVKELTKSQESLNNTFNILIHEFCDVEYLNC